MRRNLFPVGTRSVLYGVHCPLIHTFAVAYAWTKLYGFPWDYRLWFCFACHDLGYWGCTSLDGPDGKLHPRVGADIARRWLGDEYGDLVLFHSRHYSRMNNREPSRLCAPDKLASTVLPAWLYLTLASLTGEIREYMREENSVILSERTGTLIHDKWSWYRALQGYLQQEAERTIV